MIQPENENNVTMMKNPPLLEKKRRRRRKRRNMKLKMIALIRGIIKKEDCSNEASSKTKNIQKTSTPPSKKKLTVMETLQINKMKQDVEAGDKKKKRKCGKNTAEVTAEKSHFLQQVAECVSKKCGRGKLIVNF